MLKTFIKHLHEPPCILSTSPQTEPACTSVMATSVISPSGNGQRLLSITEDDHRGILWITSILCCIYAVAVLCIRTVINGYEQRLDDWLAVGATVNVILWES